MISYDPHRRFAVLLMRGVYAEGKLRVENEELLRLAQAERRPVNPLRVLIYQGGGRLIFTVRLGGDTVTIARGQKDAIISMPDDTFVAGWEAEDHAYALFSGPAPYFDMLASILLATKEAFHDPSV